MNVFIILPDKTQHKLEIDERITISQLKNIIYDKFQIVILKQRLIYNGYTLLDDYTIDNSNITNNSKIFLIYQLY
jgi:hypothetical protein